MAQLIKLYDYISRYEWNVYRYPSQYIRLKQENWRHLYNNWTNRSLGEQVLEEPQEEQSKLMKVKEFLFKYSKQTKEENSDDQQPELFIESEHELKQYFLNELFPFQLKWATSTVTDTSILDKDYQQDKTLKYFLQRFPDIYLIMYYPVFNIKNAPVDSEIIIISPSEIEIITLIEREADATIMASDDRTWTVEQGNDINNIISPLIALRRSEHVVKTILNDKQIDFPIKKTVLSRTNQIVFTTEPYSTKIVGKFQYEDWFNFKRKISSPLKSEQLKVAEALLDFCVSVSVKRPEWENENEDPFIVGE